MPDPSSENAEAIPVTVLTGFLGSGKTTILAHLLKNPLLKKTAIIINEFGEVGLDHELLESASEDLVLLANGCVCCTVRGDLITAFEKLNAQRASDPGFAIDRVLIETTGLADPAPILHTILSEPTVTAHYRLEQVIATVDAVNGMSTLDQHQEAVKQAAVADRLLLTKVDLVSPERMSALRTRLSALNPAAPVTDVINGEIGPEDLFAHSGFDPASKTVQVREWLNVEAYEHHGHHSHDHRNDSQDVNRHDDRIRAYSVIRETPISWEGFSRWLEMIGSMRGDDLLRVKGIVNVVEHPSRPIVIHGVQHIFHPPGFLEEWPSEDHRTRLVFITRDIDKDVIEDTLQIFENRKPRPAT
jgi:G3E family GTPase